MINNNNNNTYNNNNNNNNNNININNNNNNNNNIITTATGTPNGCPVNEHLPSQAKFYYKHPRNFSRNKTP